MIVLKVISYNGAPSDGAVTSFDEIGGTIGRANENQMVLPDPERTISRVHAQVLFRGGAYVVVDRGSNPISINGRPVGKGREGNIKPGDQLQIGGYVLEVGSGNDSSAPDPFADVFGDLAPTPPRAPAPPPRSISTDPIRSADSVAPPRAGTIPLDWDPFAQDSPQPLESARPSVATATRPSASAMPLTGGGGAESLDQMFGLSNAPASSDLLARVGLADKQVAPNANTGGDLLGLLARGPTPAGPTVSDHGSELHTPWVAPPTGPRSHVAPPGAVLSWEKATPEVAREKPVPAHRIPAPVDKRPPPTAAPPAPHRDAPPQKVQAAARPETSQAASNQSATEDHRALLAALREGLASPTLPLEALTPELMRRIGQMLRESTRGALDLLGARAALKREVRADVTTIVPRNNNPLKFSPTVDIALQHLIGPTSKGFLTPEAAVRDAFNDLRAHQLGVMAGMRAALEGVLLRFDPKELERKIAPRSGLMGLIAANRKARLWELFEELSSQLSTEAADDFQALFGKAFLEAYEAHIDALDKDPDTR